MIVTRYSQLPVEVSLVIDNFNPSTHRELCVWRHRILDFYRVTSRDVLSGKTSDHECYFLSVSEANKYWSQLMAEKEYLF